MMRMSRGTIGTPRPQSYRSSSSTSDLSSYDHATSGGALPVQLPGEPSEGHPSCHPLSPAKSTSSIDQLSHVHSKRGRAYSSFSTSSGVLEYPPPGVSGRERSGSLTHFCWRWPPRRDETTRQVKEITATQTGKQDIELLLTGDVTVYIEDSRESTHSNDKKLLEPISD